MEMENQDKDRFPKNQNAFQAFSLVSNNNWESSYRTRQDGHSEK